jgi:hypothetical protein
MNVLRLLVYGTMILSFTVTAQQEWRRALPGEPLYEAKQRIETAELNAAVDPLERAEVHTRHADRRMEEIQSLSEQGRPEHIDDLGNRYANSMNNASTEIDRARNQGRDVNQALANVERSTAKHTEVLTGVHGRVPEQARPAIERAIDASRRGRESAQRQLQTERMRGSGRDNDREGASGMPGVGTGQQGRSMPGDRGSSQIERGGFGRDRPGEIGGGRSGGSGSPGGSGR